MRQHVRLDRPVRALYLGLLAAGCHPSSPTLVPSAASQVGRDQVLQWVQATAPSGHRLLRFRWQYRDGQGAAVGGRGTARLAGPDSLRFDVAGPFGAGAGAAVVVGDSALWTDPPDVVTRLVPSYPLLWALFGVARMPAPGADLRGSETPDAAAWQYAEGTDTVSYRRTLTDAGRLLTEVRQEGKVLGYAETTLGPDGVPAASRLTIPGIPARLDITFVSNSRPTRFGPEVWNPR